MDFDETGLQQEILAALRRQLGARGDRGVAAEDATHSCLAELDLFGLEVGATDGGLELGLSPGIVVCEELGRRGLRDEYRATALLADLLHAGAGDGGDALVAKIARGELVAAAATQPNAVAMESTAEGVVLRGHAVIVDPLERAGALVVRARDRSGEVIVALPIPMPGVAAESARWEVAGTLSFESSAIEPIAMIRWPEAGEQTPSTLVTRAQVRQAAYLLGLADYAHELAVARALCRQQFGRAIADYQGVAFPLAAQVARLHALRLLIQRAAWLIDEQRVEGAWAGPEALASASELALESCRRSVQIHGALGMTSAEDVSRLYVAVGVEATRWGAPSSLWREAGQQRERLERRAAR